MEQKFKQVPFDIELAKKIQSGEIEGRIVTTEGNSVRIICFDRSGFADKILGLVAIDAQSEYGYELEISYCEDGSSSKQSRHDLVIELSEEAPEEQHPIEESELYQAGYKVGFEAGRCVAFDEKKECDIKKETPRHEFKVGDLVRYKDGENHTGAIYEIIEIEGNVATLQNIFKTTLTHSLDVLELVEEKKQNEFKPFDKVLVRSREDMAWCADLFSHISEYEYECVGGGWRYCIPYEGNEHLIGTTDNLTK